MYYFSTLIAWRMLCASRRSQNIPQIVQVQIKEMSLECIAAKSRFRHGYRCSSLILCAISCNTIQRLHTMSHMLSSNKWCEEKLKEESFCGSAIHRSVTTNPGCLVWVTSTSVNNEYELFRSPKFREAGNPRCDVWSRRRRQHTAILLFDCVALEMTGTNLN